MVSVHATIQMHLAGGASCVGALSCGSAQLDTDVAACCASHDGHAPPLQLPGLHHLCQRNHWHEGVTQGLSLCLGKMIMLVHKIMPLSFGVLSDLRSNVDGPSSMDICIHAPMIMMHSSRDVF